MDGALQYEVYRDSGVDWIGDVPSDWSVKRLKFLFRETNARTRTGQETLYSLRMIEGLVPHDEVSDKPIAPEDLVDYKLISPGQVVMNRMRAAIGIFGVAPASGLVSPDYAIFDVDPEVDAQFFLRVFKTNLMGTRFRLASKGMGTGSQGFMRLYTEEFGDIKVAVPPLKTQREIVKAVDEKTAEIDEAIGKKRRLIELLNEQKAILINRVVTRGLDPSVPMKDSGVDWIGEIPAHWDSASLKHYCTLIKDGLHHTPEKFDEGANFVSTQHVRHRMVDLSSASKISMKDYRSGHTKSKPEAGDVLITLVGSIGFSAIVEDEHLPLSCTRHVGYVRCKDQRLSNSFLVEYFESASFKGFVGEYVSQTAQPSIYLATLAAHKFPVPPFEEQLDIAEACRDIAAEFQPALDREQQSIDALIEFKQTLIANAVTGKIKI